MDPRFVARMERLHNKTFHHKITEASYRFFKKDSGDREEAFMALLHTAHALIDRYDMQDMRAAHITDILLGRLQYNKDYIIAIDKDIQFVVFFLEHSGIIFGASKMLKTDDGYKRFPVTVLSPDMYPNKNDTSTGTFVELLSKVKLKGEGSQANNRMIKNLIDANKTSE